jgi:DNA-binding GntR family transcriptional regulator
MMNNSLRDKAYESIKNKIISFEIKPGEVLRESIVTKELGMGRTPAREAFLMLEQERLIECISNVGYMDQKLTRKEADDYYALREALEEFAAPFIIERITSGEIAELKKIQTKSEKYAADRNIHGVASCNTEFHELLYKATGSDAFLGLISHLIDKIRWLLAMAVASQTGPTEALKDHLRIIKAIENRSVSDLQAEIRLHLKHAKERYLSLVEMLL